MGFNFKIWCNTVASCEINLECLFIKLANEISRSIYECFYYCFKTAAIDTPGGKRNLKMKIKAQQMTFRQDMTKI